MKKKLIFYFLTSLSILFCYCESNNLYEKQIKELDSLQIVLKEAISNFNDIDSLKCYKAYEKQYTYSNFINDNLSDTVSKETAKNLKLFYLVGKNLVNYLAMNSKWKEEANLSIKQLSDLNHDLKNGHIEDESVFEYISEEKTEVLKVIEMLKSNTELIRSSLETFDKTLPAAKETAKKLNGGLLPELVKPEIKTFLETIN